MSKTKTAAKVSKTTRFEVFKRDGFTCQYCGQAAPDVILHVDHIKPRAKGGKNDLLNLVTSCENCNLGKGRKELSDDSALERQKRQLAELNERRLQMEEMIKWREDLRSLQEQTLGKVVSYLETLIDPIGISDHGRQSLRKLLTKYGVEEVLATIDIACESYVKYGDNGPDKESVEKAFSKLGGILFNRANPGKARHSQDAYYIRGILRRRVYVNERIVMDLITQAENLGVNMEAMKDLAKAVRNWTEFRTEVEEYIEGRDGEN